LFLFLLFFPRATPLSPPKSPSTNPSYLTALLVTATCIIHAIATFTISLVLIARHPDHLQTWANTLGILATLLASIQYFPQLYTTFQLKHVGSLSIPMMCIQTPGSFVWAGSLAARLGREGWSSWGVYVVTGCLQGGLLGMGIYYEVMDRRRRKDQETHRGVENENVSVNGDVWGSGTDGEGAHEVEGDGDERNEQTPLLRDGG
ncbi:MAG: hypothetical protein M1830_007688, partial [Pleopsidium flavum]